MPSSSPTQNAPDFVEQSLYEVHRKVYPRAVSGWFATWRWTMVWFTQLLYYGTCWLTWNGRQAVLFDLVHRKFYIFGMVFWPQDVIFLTVLLIISAYSLFLFTAVGGRLWCGYTCPQTVYTEIFLWIEHVIEGDRAARMRLDNAPLSVEKVFRKGLKYAVWGAVALWTGITFVGYFTPIKTLLASLTSFSLGPWETFWILFYGSATYLFAGKLREQVCKYMCPYARFQGVMFDQDTLTVTYDTARGEPRGSRRKGVEPASIGKGDCVDCSICVQVCPTGIDIRNGLQYECIGCAACIDACDQVMEKMEYPKGLIRYSTAHAIKARWGWKEILRHVLRPRIVIYSVILWVIIIAFVWGLAARSPLRVDVIRDRAILAREVEGGLIENVYRLHVMNIAEAPRHYRVSVTGLPDIGLAGDTLLSLPAEADATYTLHVRVPAGAGKNGSNLIHFDVQAIEDPKLISHEKATFLIP
jgi:cytochrome c oxidase accessory protein FixG